MSSAVGRVGRHARPHASIGWGWPLAVRVRRRAALRAELHLAAGERILITVSRARGVDAVVGTERALYWQPSGAAWLRLGWEEISRVSPDTDERCLVVTTISHGAPRHAVLASLANHRLLDFVQDRVAATRVVLTPISVDGHELVVDARRQPATGRLHWLVGVNPRQSAADPGLPAAIDRAIEQVRAGLSV